MNPKYSCFKKTHSDGKGHGIEILWQWDGGHYGGCTQKQHNWHLITSSELGDQADYCLRGNWWHLSQKQSMASRFTLLIKITLLWKSLSTPVPICSVKYIQLINIHTQISLHKDYRTVYMSANFFKMCFCVCNVWRCGRGRVMQLISGTILHHFCTLFFEAGSLSETQSVPTWLVLLASY